MALGSPHSWDRQTAPSGLSIPPTRPSLPGLGTDLGAENSAPVNSGGSEAQIKHLLLSKVSPPHPSLSWFAAPLCEPRQPHTWPVISVHISFHFPLSLRDPGGQGLGSSAPGPSTGPGTAGSPIK